MTDYETLELASKIYLTVERGSTLSGNAVAIDLDSKFNQLLLALSVIELEEV